MFCLVLMEGTQLAKYEALLPGKVRLFSVKYDHTIDQYKHSSLKNYNKEMCLLYLVSYVF